MCIRDSVTSYILKQLTSFHISPEINGPYTIKAGALAHLRTDFSFSLPDKAVIGSLLKALHPTPVSYTHLDVYKRQQRSCAGSGASTVLW